MSEYTDEQLYRIACAVEKIVEGQKVEDEATIVASIYNMIALELEKILDNATNEFDLRRQLRELVTKAKISQ